MTTQTIRTIRYYVSPLLLVIIGATILWAVWAFYNPIPPAPARYEDAEHGVMCYTYRGAISCVRVDK